MSTLTLADTVTASRDQVFADLADEAVILGMRDGVYYGVDGVAARIWALMQQPVQLGELTSLLCAEYDVDADRCAADVLAFAEVLLAKGLVARVVPAPTP
jgi:hypothetical protein